MFLITTIPYLETCRHGCDQKPASVLVCQGNNLISPQPEGQSYDFTSGVCMRQISLLLGASIPEYTPPGLRRGKITERLIAPSIMALKEHTGQGPSNGETPATFTGKHTEIEKQYAHFWSLPQAGADSLAYFQGKAPYTFTPEEGRDPKTWVQQSPKFATPKAEEILADDQNAVIIRNSYSYYSGQYPDRPGCASMSMVHLLAISKARYFNGVSLNCDTVHIIDDMIALFKKNWEEKEFRDKVIKNQRELVKNADPQGANEAATRAALALIDQLEEEIDNLSAEDDFLFGLHLYPHHSVSHLHLHIIAKGEKFRQFSCRDHDEKTKDALEVRNYIKSLCELPEPHKSNQTRFR